MLREDMIEDAAETVLRRLESVRARRAGPGVQGSKAIASSAERPPAGDVVLITSPGARIGLREMQGTIADNSRYDSFDLVAAALAGQGKYR